MTSGICLPDRYSGVFSARPILAWRLQDFFHLFLGHVVIANLRVAGGRVNIEPDPHRPNFIAIPLSRATMRVDNQAR
jgi:hypothetical protein